jgi:hypothetical protein
LSVIEGDNLDKKGIVLSGLIDCGIVVVDDLLVTILFIDGWAFGLAGCIGDGIGSIDEDLDGVTLFYFGGVDSFIPLSQGGDCVLLEGIHNCLFGIFGLSFSDIDTAYA